MPGDGEKNLGIKICVSVPATEREKYRTEEEATLQRSKISKGFMILMHHQVHHIMDKEVHQLPPMAVDMEAHLDQTSPQGVEPYPISLTKGVGMMWIQKISGFYMHVGCHSMFFAHLIGMKWFLPLMMPPKDTGALGMTRPEPWDLIMKELK